MGWEMDQFSRNFNILHYNNAMKISKALGIRPPRVSTYSLLDKAFAWPRVRLFEDVQENLETLEKFEDDLNQNIHNSRLVKNFIRTGLAVVGNLSEKYGNGGGFAKP